MIEFEQPIPAPFLFAPEAVAATLAGLPALRARVPAPDAEGTPSAAFAAVNKTPRQIYRALAYHEEMPSLGKLLKRVDHWLDRGWPARKLLGRARDQFRSALAELEVADHFDTRGFEVTSAEAAAGGGSAPDVLVDGKGLRANVEVYSPVEWEGLDAFQGEGWDTLRNLDLPFAYQFSFNTKRRQPIGERGYVSLHPELLARGLARPTARERLLRPLLDGVLDQLAAEAFEVGACYEDLDLDIVVEVELSGVRRVDAFTPRGGSWGFSDIGGYRPELMFDGIVERIGRKAERRQAQSADALEVVIADMSRVELQSELTHAEYYRPRFARALKGRFGDERQLPCDVVALCASRGWGQELLTYFLVARDDAQPAAEQLFGRLAAVELG
jgi:hypothetical protein